MTGIIDGFVYLGRVSMTQSGSLSIFSSREQEYEQKAQLLKRLAYVIFCSEMDQYAKYMPDIQGKRTRKCSLEQFIIFLIWFQNN